MDLLALPEFITASILTEWLEFRCLAGLDKAYCNWISRTSYLAALKFKGSIFAPAGCRRSQHLQTLMEWATSRQLHFKKISVSETTDVDGTLAFLRTQSPTLESLLLFGVHPTMLLQLQQQRLHLNRLKSLHMGISDGSYNEEFAFLSLYSETLEYLSLRDTVRMEQVVLPRPMPKLHTILLDNNVWLNGNHSETRYAVGTDCHLFRNCPNLLRLFALTSNKNAPILHALAAHCLHLQQLHVAFSEQSNKISVTEALVAVLQGCPALRVLDFTTALIISDEQFATVAAHCGRLTALRLSRISAATLAVLLPGLRSVRHFDLGTIVGDEAYLSSLSQRGGELKSLALSYYIADVPTEIVINLCRSLTSVEEVHLLFRTPAWITDEVLRTIATHCRSLRRLSLGCAMVHANRVADISEGIAALLHGCPLLKEVHVSGVEILPAELRALRPDVTFRARDFAPCSFWCAPENCAETY